MKRQLIFLKYNYDFLIVGLTTILVVFNFFAAGLKFSSVSSLIFKTTIILLTLVYIIKFILFLKKNIPLVLHNKNKLIEHITLDKYKVLSAILLFLIFLFTLTHLIITHANFFDIQYMTKYIVFIYTLFYIFLITFSNIKIYNILKVLIFAFFCLGVFLIISFLSGFGKNWRGVTPGSGLTLNYYNPNYAAEILYFIIIYLIIGLFVYHNIFIKFFFIVTIFFSTYLLYLTGSRNPIIAILFSFVVSFLFYSFNKRGDSKKTKLFFGFFLSIAPLFIAEVYIISIKALEASNTLFLIGGKSINSRFDIWISALKAFLENPLLGSYTTYGDGSGAFQMHNSHLDVLASYGLIPFMLVILFLFIIIYQALNYGNNSKRNIVCLAAMISAVLFGINEASFLYSGSGTFILAFFLLPLSKTPITSSKLLVKYYYSNKNFNYNRKHKTVLQISNVYDYGSTGYLVKRNHNNLLAQGYNSCVIYGRKKRPTEEVNVVHIGNEFLSKINKLLCKIWNNPLGFCRLNTLMILREISEIRPDLIHIHCTNDYYVNTNMLLNFLRKRGIPTVITLHSEMLYLGNCGGNSYDCSNWKTECLNCPLHLGSSRLPHKLWIKRSNIISKFQNGKLAITAVSPWLANRAKESNMFGNRPILTIYNGIRIENVVHNKSIKHIRPRIIYITASLQNPNKGFNYVLELSSLKQECDFIVVAQNLRGIVEKSNISYVGPIVDKGELYKIIKESDCSIITSKSETFSMPVIESLCCGVPVAGFKSGGPESIALKDASCFVDYGNVSSLSKAVDRMLQIKNREEIMDISKNLYSDSKMTKSFIQLYNELSNRFSRTEKGTLFVVLDI